MPFLLLYNLHSQMLIIYPVLLSFTTTTHAFSNSLDAHAPIKHRTVPFFHSSPWFSLMLSALKTLQKSLHNLNKFKTHPATVTQSVTQGLVLGADETYFFLH